MSIIEQIQNNAVTNFSNMQNRVEFDPAMILIIAELVMEVISSLGNCADINKATEVVNSPTWLQTRILYFKTRRALGRREYRKSGNAVVKAILDAGKDVTRFQMSQAYDELG